MVDNKKASGHVAGNFITRKSGNSLSLTVPSDAGIPEGKEYVLTIMEDGTLAYRPQRQNVEILFLWMQSHMLGKNMEVMI